MIRREGNVQVPAAKCTKHLLFRHHTKVDAHLWICALECPKSTGKDLNSGGDRVAHVDLISLLIRDGLSQSNCIFRPLQRCMSLKKKNLACFG